MEFTTQRELLEYLGKNPDDRNLVQRLIIKGEVVREWGVYVLVDKDARIAELERKVSELRNEIVTMKDICYNKVKAAMGSRYTESREEFKEWIGNMLKRPSED